MFDGDKFWNICGVWEKSISLLMKIALFFTIFFRKLLGFLTFFLPVFLLYLYAVYLSNRKYKYKPELLWLLIFKVVFLTHGLGGVFYVAFMKECMKSFTIGWLRLNLILVLVLVGLQAYVSYLHKVQVFWGCLKVWKNHPHRFDVYFVDLSKYFNHAIYMIFTSTNRN